MEYIFAGALQYNMENIVYVYLCPTCHALVPEGATDHHEDWHKNLETI